MTDKLTVFGVGRGNTSITSPLMDAAEDCDAVAARTIMPQGTMRTFFHAFIKNPTVTLFIVLYDMARLLVSYALYREWKSPAVLSAERTAAAKELRIIRVQNDALNRIRDQGWSWFILSWLFFFGILTPFFSSGPRYTFTSALIGGLVTGWIFTYAFVRATRMDWLHNALDQTLTQAEQRDCDSVCLVTGAAQVDAVERLAHLADIETARTVTPPLWSVIWEKVPVRVK